MHSNALFDDAIRRNEKLGILQLNQICFGTSKDVTSCYLLLVGFRVFCEACWTCWSALSRLAGCIDPPSMYGSMNGIKFGRGTFGGISGDQLPRLCSTRTPLSYPIPTSSGTVNVFSTPDDDVVDGVICGTCSIQYTVQQLAFFVFSWPNLPNASTTYLYWICI